MMTSFEQWLNASCELTDCRLEPLAGDASFRRYVRVHHLDQTYIAMDASLEKASCVPFVAIAKSLQKRGLCAPRIFAENLSEGFLLLEDFGDRLLLRELTKTNALTHYQHALDTLVIMQQTTVDDWTLKPFTAEFMRAELMLFKEWFLEKHLMLALTDLTHHMLDETFDCLAREAAVQPKVFMHRDYHSANLMVLPEDKIGVLDFQDAFYGPVTYDLVSLLRDCYIDWPEQMVQELVRFFYEKIKLPSVSFNAFLRWFDWMGVQRHLKALLTFSRKYQRDHNDHYLQYIPRTLNYVLTISERYAEMKSLHQFLKNQVVEKCVE